MKCSPVTPLEVWCCFLVLIQLTKAIENISAVIHTELVCGWSTLEAKCGFGEVIYVIRANYGRTSLLPCNDDNLPWDIDCDFPGTNSIVRLRCEGKRSCKVPATTAVFGDPCIGIQKYLEMDFKCIPGKPLLLIADPDTGIQAIDIETSEAIPLTGDIKAIKNIRAFDYVYRTKTIVWTDTRTELIYSAPIESNGEITTVLHDSTPTGLAVDWIHDKIYWTDLMRKRISVANLDGSWEKTLFNTDHKILDSIVIDPLQAWMFWTDCGDTPKIERAGMDGSNRNVIVSTDLHRPCSMTLDLSARLIYWMDGGTNEICRANYDGIIRITILKSTQYLQEHTSINLFKEDMYWKSEGRIYKANNFNGKSLTQAVNGRSWRFIRDIKIYHNSHQPAGPNSCGKENGGCSHLCLPSPQLQGIYGHKPYTCVCPNNVRNCLKEDDDITGQNNEFNIRSSQVVVVPFLMTKLLALITLVILLDY